MWKILEFLSENFQFLEVEFSIHLNRRIFVMEKLPDSTQQTHNVATTSQERRDVLATL